MVDGSEAAAEHYFGVGDQTRLLRYLQLDVMMFLRRQRQRAFAHALEQTVQRHRLADVVGLGILQPRQQQQVVHQRFHAVALGIHLVQCPA